MSDVIEYGVGHNSQAMILVGDDLTDMLAMENAEILSRRDELVEAESRMPEIVDTETAKKASDYIDFLNALNGNMQAAHDEAKKPYLAGGATVDEFFYRGIRDPIAGVLMRVKGMLKKYLDAKLAAERKARDEAERTARLEAERLAREAQEAASKLTSEAQLPAALQAEAVAEVAKVAAVEAAQLASAPSNELASVKGSVGRAKSLKTFWDFRDLNRAVLDLEALRPYLPVDGLEKALRAFVAAGGRKIGGADIFENTKL